MRSSVRSSPSKWSAVALCSAGGVASCSRDTSCSLRSALPRSGAVAVTFPPKFPIPVLWYKGTSKILSCLLARGEFTSWYAEGQQIGMADEIQVGWCCCPFCARLLRDTRCSGVGSDALLWMGNWQEFREGCAHGFCSCVLHFLHCVTVCWNWNSYKYWNKPQAGGGCKERPRSMC